jgi:hypothetical protein
MIAPTAFVKVAAAGALILAAMAGGWAWHASSLGNRLQDAQAAAAVAGQARDNATFASGEWQAGELQARVDLQKCQSQWAEAKADAVFQAAAAAEHRRNAARWAEAFAGRFAGRTPECAAALAALDPACPELEGY